MDSRHIQNLVKFKNNRVANINVTIFFKTLL